jgi:hypothetical protein
MRSVILGIGIAVLFCGGAFAADKRVPVTIVGCVQDGAAGTFVLTGVREVENGDLKPTDAIYWLSSTKGLKEHVGHIVEVSGSFSPARDAGKTGKIKIETDAVTGDAKVAVENGIKKAEMTTRRDVVGTAGVKTEIVKPYRRLEVDSLKMVDGRCK